MTFEDMLKESLGFDMREADRKVQDCLDGPKEERDEIVKLSKEMMCKRLDKPLEDHTMLEKIGATMSFKASADAMPPNLMWITDCFVVSMTLYLEDGDNDKFLSRTENIMRYVEKYRHELAGKKKEE